MSKYSLILMACLVVVIAGCGSKTSSGTATEKDKANIERLAKEGVGAPKSADEEAK